MKIAHYRRSECRLCGSHDLKEVLKLTPTPLANSLVPVSMLENEQPTFPLDVFLCVNCKHVQLLDVVDPRALYDNYVYVSGTSQVFVEHFKSYAEFMTRNYGGRGGSLVVDIGSNDGTLLDFFKGLGYRILGVDPAKKIAMNANKRGIPTIIEFFTEALAKKILVEHGTAAIVTANNVFAHSDDLGKFLDGVKILIGNKGVFSFEVSYLRDVLEKTLFDTIYHEHLDYHSLAPLVPFFLTHDMEIIDAIRTDTHGGSLRCIAQAKGGIWPVASSVSRLVQEEVDLGLQNIEAYENFSRHIMEIGSELNTLLRKLKGDGKRISAYGAPAKAVTLMYHFNIGPELIDFIVDDSPWKQGLYMPGMNIPIRPSSAIEDSEPDYLLILAWNFTESIIAKNQNFRKRGGKFIIPLPAVSVQ